MTEKHKSTYKTLPNPGQPHYTEAWALIEAARRMADVIKNGIPVDIKDRNAVRDALRLNWRLWTIFQAELTTNEDTPISDDIRQNMLTLCKFVDHHTASILSDPTPEAIVSLIDINRNIASGLLELSEDEVSSEAKTSHSTGPYQPKKPQESTSKPSPLTTTADNPGGFSFNEEI